jgi:hypothetical protein
MLKLSVNVNMIFGVSLLNRALQILLLKKVPRFAEFPFRIATHGVEFLGGSSTMACE